MALGTPSSARLCRLDRKLMTGKKSHFHDDTQIKNEYLFPKHHRGFWTGVCHLTGHFTLGPIFFSHLILLVPSAVPSA